MRASDGDVYYVWIFAILGLIVVLRRQSDDLTCGIFYAIRGITTRYRKMKHVLLLEFI
jgi:hypothetical protein